MKKLNLIIILFSLAWCINTAPAHAAAELKCTIDTHGAPSDISFLKDIQAHLLTSPFYKELQSHLGSPENCSIAFPYDEGNYKITYFFPKGGKYVHSSIVSANTDYIFMETMDKSQAMNLLKTATRSLGSDAQYIDWSKPKHYDNFEDDEVKGATSTLNWNYIDNEGAGSAIFAAIHYYHEKIIGLQCGVGVD